MGTRRRGIAAVVLSVAAGAASVPAQALDLQELARKVEQLEQRVESAEARAARSEAQLRTTESKLQATEQELQTLRTQSDGMQQQIAVTGEMLERAETQLSQGGVNNWAQNTRIGAYGELHFNNTNLTDEIDFHRFVAYLSHEFSDRLRFFSEVELEHSLAGDGKPGEVELEQAYIEYDLTETLATQVGLFLIPVGILNQTHEPDTFYGVERNRVEQEIIPTTWWEAGAGLTGELLPGLSFDVAVHSGLSVPTEGGNAFRIRSGRQKVAEAPAEDPAYTGRLRYALMPGVEIAATVQFQEDLTQSDPMTDTASAWLYETHLVVERGPFDLRALYARWDIDGDEARMIGRDEQYGWYVEPGWRFNEHLGIFVRYSEWDTFDGNSADTTFKDRTAGLNWWLHPRVVLKFDYMDRLVPGGKDEHGFNLGMGFSFE